jgi:hypothetical protein
MGPRMRLLTSNDGFVTGISLIPMSLGGKRLTLLPIPARSH